MADDIILNAGDSGGATVATDEIGGKNYQWIKLAFGPDDTATKITASVGLPVIMLAGTAEIGKLAAGVAEIGNVKNSGTFAVQSTLQAGTAEFGKLAAGVAEIGNVKNSGTFQVQEDGAALTSLQLIDNIVQVEDAAHNSGDSGVMALAVRNDANAVLGADGDYVPVSTNESGSLWTHEEPTFIDSGNSSTTPLAGDAVFTGTAINVRDFAAITVFIDSDQNSAIDGLSMQLSSDGVNWDVQRDFSYLAATDGSLFQQGALAEFFRLVYTNGSTPQTTFRLQTLFHHTTPITATHRLSDNEDPDGYSTLTKSAIIAQAAGTGDFKPVQSTAGGNLKVSIEESNGDITGGGTEATALRVTMASDSTGLLSVDDGGASLTVDNAGLTELAAAINGNELDVNIASSNATVTVDLGANNDVSLNAGANLVGDVGLSGARTSGGTTPYKNLDVDETEDEVKGTAGQVYWIHAINLTAGPLYLKFYNLTAANTTVGTSTPVLTLPVPANADSDGAGFMLSIPNGIEFDTAITIAGLTGLADNDTTGPGNNELIVNLGYA